MKLLKKIGKAILYPHIAILILLVPMSVVILVFSMIKFEPSHIACIISYLIAFYSLLTVCFRIPSMITTIKVLKKENELIKRWNTDAHMRIKISLYVSLIFNGAYAVFQLALGFAYSSFWFYSMAFYYTTLALVRFFLLQHTRTHRAREELRSELVKYRFCGYVLFVMNIALAVIVFFMVYWNKAFIYNEILTITLATYTFTSFTLSIISFVKYKKYESPVYSATKIIGLVSACVSILTLEATMLSAFGGTDNSLFKQIMLATTGGVISVVMVIVAIYMIVRGTKELKNK